MQRVLLTLLTTWQNKKIGDKLNFTREPIIETVITPKEGNKLVIRNSKGSGQDEFFVDAIEVISFGNTSFFRSLEKPKSFLVPVNDYEILEVREARMVLKTTALEKGVKIGGGREAPSKPTPQKEENPIQEVEAAAIAEQKADKRRERRRYRKKRGKSELDEKSAGDSVEQVSEKKIDKPSLIPPPSTLISETIRPRQQQHSKPIEKHEAEEVHEQILPPPLTTLVSESTEEKDEEIPF